MAPDAPLQDGQSEERQFEDGVHEKFADSLPSDGGIVNLPAGKALTHIEASQILRSAICPVVVLAGAAKSGKTTLLASIHDSFSMETICRICRCRVQNSALDMRSDVSTPVPRRPRKCRTL